MGHVLFRLLVHGFFRPGRLKIAAILPIAILWFVFAGAANAATPTSGSINDPANPSTTWQGAFFVTSTISDPSQCTPGDQGIGCDTFQLTTQTTGPVRVAVTWPGPTCALAPAGTCTDAAANDFDLLICDDSTIDIGEMFPPMTDPFGNFLPNPMNPTNIPPDRCTGGTEVAFSQTNRIGFEDVSWPATAGKTYEVRVLPFSITPPGTDYAGCAEYVNATGGPFCAQPPVVTPPPVSSSAFFTGCQGTATADRQVQGGGKLPASTDPTQNAHFALNVQRKTRNSVQKLKGKLAYSEDHTLNFRSKNVRCAGFTDGTNNNKDNTTVFRGRVEIRGFGTLRQGDGSEEHGDKNGQLVCYRAVATDNGQPGKGRDQFEIEIYAYDPTTDTCAGVAENANNAVITDGNIVYVYHCNDQEYGNSDDD
jgi:hypothetical protein